MDALFLMLFTIVTIIGCMLAAAAIIVLGSLTTIYLGKVSINGFIVKFNTGCERFVLCDKAYIKRGMETRPASVSVEVQDLYDSRFGKFAADRYVEVKEGYTYLPFILDAITLGNRVRSKGILRTFFSM